MDVSEDLGTALMLENDRVRIWEHRVPAGATGPMHLHRRPYLSVVVRGSRGENVDADGDNEQPSKPDVDLACHFLRPPLSPKRTRFLWRADPVQAAWKLEDSPRSERRGTSTRSALMSR